MNKQLKLDLHIHSMYSVDSNSKIQAIISMAEKRGLDGIAITDHNSLEGSKQAIKLNNTNLLIIPGAEYSTDIGHLLVYFLKEGLEDLGLKRDIQGLYNSSDIIGSAHEQNALVFMAHPFQRVTDFNKRGFDLVDGIEVYNSRAAKWRNLSANLDAMEQAIKLNKPYTAGSDAHYINEIGNAYIDINFIGNKEADIKLALQNNKRTIIGRASSSINRPKSQIIKCRKTKSLPSPKTLLKLGYFSIMEAMLYIKLNKTPIEGSFNLTNEGVERIDID